MRSERDAFLAAQQRHHQYMVFGKKQRYIEVFQCSGDDMNHLLTGSTPLSAAAANQAAALAAAVASQQAKNPNAASGLLPPGMFPAFPNLHAPTGGMDPAMAAQLHNQLQFLAAPNLAALGFPPGFPPSAAAAANIRPPAMPAALAPPFPSPGQLRSPFPPGADPASLWAAAGLSAPLMSMSTPPPSGGLATPQQPSELPFPSPGWADQAPDHPSVYSRVLCWRPESSKCGPSSKPAGCSESSDAAATAAATFDHH